MHCRGSNAGSGCAAARLGGYRAPCTSADRIRAPANTPPDRNGRLAGPDRGGFLWGCAQARARLIQALNDLTGREPRVFEPQRIMDTGCYRGPGLAYGLKGGYGSRRRAYQCFVTAYRPRIAGLPFVAGYRIPCGAYKTPSRAAYARRRGLTDADIVDAVNHVKPVGTTVWIRFR